MKFKYLTILLLFIICGCVDSVKIEDRPIFVFKFNELEFIDLSGKVELTTFPYQGKIEFSKKQVILTIIRTDNAIQNKDFNIRTVYWKEDPKELVYRTDKGNIDILYDGDKIVNVTMSGGTQIMVFKN